MWPSEAQLYGDLSVTPRRAIPETVMQGDLERECPASIGASGRLNEARLRAHCAPSSNAKQGRRPGAWGAVELD
eukprot:scaffold110617_cov24-Tisochrysis_lutea.AAC.2